MYKVAQQDPEEILPMLKYVRTRLAHGYIRRYLEIGSYAGESLLYAAKFMKPGSEATLVDLGDNKAAQANLYKVMIQLNEMGIQTYYLRGYAEDLDIVHEAHKLRRGGRWDLCLIDGCHDFRNVVQNYADYGAEANLVAFHDIDPRCIAKNIEKHGYEKPSAAHVWQVLKLSGLRTAEFINEDSEKPKGLGVVHA